MPDDNEVVMTEDVQKDAENFFWNRHWKVDWDKITSLDDLKTLLKFMNPVFNGPEEDFEEVMQFLTEITKMDEPK